MVALGVWPQFYSLGSCFPSNHLVVFQFPPVWFVSTYISALHTNERPHSVLVFVLFCFFFLILNWSFVSLLLAADGTKKRKKVISQSFTLRQSLTKRNSSGQLDLGGKITLFGHPLALICGEDDTLPQPVQVRSYHYRGAVNKGLNCQDKGEMASYWQRAGFDWTLGRNSWLWG